MAITVSGDFGHIEKFLTRPRTTNMDILGKAIVKALKDATPKESGETAESWGYRLINTPRGIDLEIYNSHLNNEIGRAHV